MHDSQSLSGILEILSGIIKFLSFVEEKAPSFNSSSDFWIITLVIFVLLKASVPIDITPNGISMAIRSDASN